MFDLFDVYIKHQNLTSVEIRQTYPNHGREIDQLIDSIDRLPVVSEPRNRGAEGRAVELFMLTFCFELVIGACVSAPFTLFEITDLELSSISSLIILLLQSFATELSESFQTLMLLNSFY